MDPHTLWYLAEAAAEGRDPVALLIGALAAVEGLAHGLPLVQDDRLRDLVARRGAGEMHDLVADWQHGFAVTFAGLNTPSPVQ